MFGPTRANQLLSKIAEQQALAIDNGKEAVVRMELFSERARIVAEQAKEIEHLKSQLNQRITALPGPRHGKS